ncbi:hypothetical protein [Deinococcus peraridilitoris]|uniref:Uncharacterized protein n=1 Tax=Deinococcus peraridilitoris (strain DSM 19664 / LMG 22246 / CIP 109416 / KR-200) TaxID=937777 RepID=L0A1S6_DEIPD|nr:hypothetical protein [Deinococcus peraridilitoris]AFZ66970.1 hypothetical protein Deipe_1429 [Deinococcus peraridilitoris DSM 19664]
MWGQIIRSFDPTGQKQREYQEATRLDPERIAHPVELTRQEKARLNALADQAEAELRRMTNAPDGFGFTLLDEATGRLLDPAKRKL